MSVMNYVHYGDSMKTLLREYENLCTLGLPTREVVPLAIQLLERMLGGSLFGFIWCDEQQAAIYAGRCYNEVFHPAGMRHALRAPVIDGEQRYGMFALTRPPGRGFSAQDEALIQHAARFLAHAFALERAGKLVMGEVTDSADEGFLVFSAHGQLLHGCELGLKWHHEATRADGIAQTASSLRGGLPSLLVTNAAKTDASREIVIANQRGTFVFRPFHLRAVEQGSPAHIAVTVRQRSSMAARIWQAGGQFNLSSRERQIAVLLAMGYGYDSIAAHLSVSRNTAVSYVRRTYEKLQVRQREQLVRTLLAPTTSPPNNNDKSA